MFFMFICRVVELFKLVFVDRYLTLSAAAADWSVMFYTVQLSNLMSTFLNTLLFR